MNIHTWVQKEHYYTVSGNNEPENNDSNYKNNDLFEYLTTTEALNFTAGGD